MAIAAAAGLFVALAPPSPSAPAQTPALIAQELRAEVAAAEEGEPVQALMMLPNTTDLDGDPGEVVDTLRDHAANTQAEVEASLGDDTRVLNRFWITNMLLVEFPASTDNLDALSLVPGVERLNTNFTLSAPTTEPTAGVSTAAETALTWGLDKIEADRAWNELGADGSGVRVAVLDTGVDLTHPDLAGRMVTDDPRDPTYPGGWMSFDYFGKPIRSMPHDSQFHGTHVSGTVLGGATSGTAIGVAPGAELMHGLVIPGGNGTFAQVIAGMEWAIAPTDAAGNPAGRPADIVSMSLGAEGYIEELIAPTRAVRAAGVFPAFAIGNNCPVGRTSSPGNVLEAVGVGATDVNDNVGDFSCGGVVNKDRWTYHAPADWPDSWIKPDLSAPGVAVQSAYPGNTYKSLNGTSMATPHTAGTVALMMSATNDTLSVDEIQNVLVDTAYWDNRYAESAPDTRFGAGRINAYEATRFVAANSGIQGTVTSASTGAPVEGATVSFGPEARETVTAADGSFAGRLLPGTYQVSVELFGYETATSTVEVVKGSFATVDIKLTALAAGQVTGTVTVDGSGHGLPGATVRVSGVVTDLSAVTAEDGTYTIEDVPAGEYTVEASHPTFRAPDPVQVTVTGGQAARADFAFLVPRKSVAVVSAFGVGYDQLVKRVFEPHGIDSAVYEWNQLDEAAKHDTVVLGYGGSTHYDAARFQAFLDTTDANGTGVIATHYVSNFMSGVQQLSKHTGQPASTGQDKLTYGEMDLYYEVTSTHPLLAGYEVGDRIVLNSTYGNKWTGYFDGYQGEGRQIIGTVGNTDGGTVGGGIGVDQRANNRHVLLSAHGLWAAESVTKWTDAATDIFLRAIDWATSGQNADEPYFAPYDLRVSPGVVQVDEDVTVSVQVKNVGGAAGSYDAVLRVGGEVAATTPVPLAAGESKTVEWTVEADQLGQTTVEVDRLTSSFRVRTPIVTVQAATVNAPGADRVGPLAGATVELVDGGELTTIGTTDANGTLSFEAPRTIGRYTLVVRRPTADGVGYLLHREITVIDDETVSFAPRVLAGGRMAAAGIGDNFAVRANLQLDRVDERHTGSVYLRPAGVGPLGYLYQPGTLIASLGQYEAATVHGVSFFDQSWFLPSRVIGGLDWIDPFDTTFTFGGPVTVNVGDAEVGADGKATVDWSVTDAHGTPFATVASADERLVLDLPERAALEDVQKLVRAAAPTELKPALRLYDPTGRMVRSSRIDWAAQPYTFPVDPAAPDGAYRLTLNVDTGGYADVVSAEATVQKGAPAVAEVSVVDTRPGTLQPGKATQYEVTATNSGTADSGPLAWTVRIDVDRGRLAPRDVVLKVRVDNRWERVRLSRDGGALVGTVLADAAVAAGAEHTWLLSLRIDRAARYTVTDTFTGAGTELTNTDEVRVGGRKLAGVR